MANVIQFSRRNSGATGAPSSAKSGQPFWNNLDKILYLGTGDDGAGNATSIEAIGGSGAVVLLTGAQTIAGAKTFSTAPISSVAASANNELVRKGEHDTDLAAKAPLASPALTGTPTAPTAAGGTNTTQIATTAFVTGALGSYAPLASPALTGTPTAPTASAGTSTTQIATTAFVAASFAPLASPALTGNPTAPTQSAGDNSTRIATTAFVHSQGYATQSYVDTAVQGLDPKASVRAATTGNVTLSGTQTIDGVALTAGQRVLVKDQTAPAENGIYVVAAGAWARATDADSWAELVSAFTFVEEGTVNADTGWTSTVNTGGTLGSTAVTWVQFSGAGQITAGAGLTKTGNTIDVVGTANRIIVNADSIDIHASYVGQTSITTLGTIGTGTWQGTLIALAYGGTGRSLSGDADGSMYKKSGTQLVVATAGTDYLNSNSTIDGGTF